MNQHIKIKAFDKDNKVLGTFLITIDIDYNTNSINNYFNSETINTEIPFNDYITLYNVPIVEKFDNKTPIQFLKNKSVNIFLLEEYQYTILFETKLKDIYPFYSLLNPNEKESPLKTVANTNSGFLNFGSYVGKSFIDIYRNEEEIFKIPIEVRSRKIDYNEQYAAMIGDLSQYSSGLLFDTKSPVHQRFESKSRKKRTSYEDFMLLEYLFRDENLPSAVEYLSRNLYSALESTIEEVPTSFASNVGPNELIDVFSSSENLSKTKDESSIWFDKTKGYIPTKINEIKYVDNIDVAENRFYKNFLEMIEDIISDLFIYNPKGYVHDRLEEYQEEISSYLSQRYFKDISQMNYPPLNSQVLQKKEGYRDILEYYLMFEFAFKMNWGAVVNEFKGYEKKLFELYEYWCYFELMNIFKDLGDLKLEFKDIFETKDDGLTIELKENLLNIFTINVKERDIRVDLRYNRTFSHGTSNEFSSYSVQLRPDYSLLIYIDGVRYIIHFDAKYKINTNWDYKNQDIHKMHTYKDAIRDTIGSYVLYPGNSGDPKLFYENDGLASVGAFPLNPGNDKLNKNVLKEFIETFIEELISYHEKENKKIMPLL